ncbi:hypothetical protein [Paenibacillus alginolyticus]|uniref:hypothetical protein n=1 Tax=Paenibacillus alginolyticus TaxID=59839 RepID=UPI002DB6CD83|nr:hypothetical protein [Paenibacillus alginolyticus]MEC0144948.1 hypothetical protein [Paenibacillus alginolyticus]
MKLTDPYHPHHHYHPHMHHHPVIIYPVPYSHHPHHPHHYPMPYHCMEGGQWTGQQGGWQGRHREEQTNKFETESGEFLVRLCPTSI